MKNNILKTSYLSIFLSVIVISIGTYQQVCSPEFEKFQQHKIDSMIASHPGEDLAPGYGLGLVLASAWPFVGFIQIIFCLIFYAGISLVRGCRERSRSTFSIFVAYILFVIICFVVIVSYAISASENFAWGFALRGMGEVMFAVGLITGVIAMLKEVFQSVSFVK